ncbi:MAG: substrate-binding domain-containing protein [Kiritimatiellia bacterium]
MGKSGVLKILVELDMRHAASRELVGGVLRFAATHRRLEVQFSSCEPPDYYIDWRPDGLITDASCQAYTTADFSVLAGRGIVYVNTKPRTDVRCPHATITTDERLLAVAAARLFLGKRLNAFAYVGTPTATRWSEVRGRFFRAVLKEAGKKLFRFSAPAAPGWQAQKRALTTWLKRLPKPCGVWAACDQRARQVLDACRLAEIAVPDQVQILGVDDEAYICEQSTPSLSSLAPDFEAGGFAVAEHLYGLLTKSRAGKGRSRLTFGLKGIVERRSTADINGTARRVAAAREYIRRHATAGITIPDIAASLGISPRLLEKNYRAVTGRTVRQDLQAAQLAKARELLRKTTIPIDTLGPFCGFTSSTYLKTLFKRTTGQTMSAYRALGQGNGKSA